MTEMLGVRPAAGPGPAPAPGPWAEFRRTPLRCQAWLLSAGIGALVLPLVLRDLGPPAAPSYILGTLAMLLVVSVLNVEIGRSLTGGLARTHQPHKALSAWAFAASLLLPPPWLLVVVPLTYAHARWRGLRVPLWKWVGSGCYLVLCGVASAVVHAVLAGDLSNWMAGDGGRGLLVLLAAAAAFLALEAVLFAGSALLNAREDEVWLRRTLTSASFYGTEGGVLLIGGLLAAVWTGGAWFVLLFVPIYALVQRAALHEPLRERAEAAAELATRNAELERAHRFKTDLLGMLGHELGNPLAAVAGFAEVATDALQRDDAAAVAGALAAVTRNADQLRRVLQEILVMVTSEGGVLTARPEPTPVLAHLRSAAAAQPPGRQPLVECPADLRVLAQPSHLDQMLANLLSNAAKYAGGAVRLRGVQVGGGRVEVAVVDEGPGVAPAFRNAVFERFTRHEDTAVSVTGTGLGLHITRELARANGGDVVLRPADRGGSAFVVVLPAA